MITPRFTLSQTDDFVIAHIDAPYVKFSEGEMYMEGNEFSFFCKPYHLKLYFSSEVIEDGSETASYDVDTGKFEVKIPKTEKGTVFKDLDMLTKIMTPLKSEQHVKASALIEVLDNSDKSADFPDYEEDDIDWSVEQTMPSVDITLHTGSPRYGFNHQYSDVFTARTEDIHELLDIEEPDSTHVQERAKLQPVREQSDFNVEHYLADLVEDEIIQEFITYKTQINIIHHKTAKGNISADELVQYNQEEMEMILRLPKKQYLLDQQETRAALVGVVDILYACLYDIRTTMEEESVESAWTIRKLSSSLSWLNCQCDIKSVLIASIRRVMCYPLYRHWVLAMKVVEDVRHVLALGRKQVLKCLLYIHKQFNNTESYHVHNSLYITDYCVWIQSVPESTLRSLCNKIRHCHLNKNDLNLDISASELRCLHDSGSSDEGTTSSDSDIDSDDDSDESVNDEKRPKSDSHQAAVDVIGQELAALTVNSSVNEMISSKTLVEIIDEENSTTENSPDS